MCITGTNIAGMSRARNMYIVVCTARASRLIRVLSAATAGSLYLASVGADIFCACEVEVERESVKISSELGSVSVGISSVMAC